MQQCGPEKDGRESGWLGSSGLEDLEGISYQCCDTLSITKPMGLINKAWSGLLQSALSIHIIAHEHFSNSFEYRLES